MMKLLKIPNHTPNCAPSILFTTKIVVAVIIIIIIIVILIIIIVILIFIAIITIIIDTGYTDNIAIVMFFLIIQVVHSSKRVLCDATHKQCSTTTARVLRASSTGCDGCHVLGWPRLSLQYYNHTTHCHHMERKLLQHNNSHILIIARSNVVVMVQTQLVQFGLNISFTQ